MNEKFAICPYDEHHVIAKLRMPYHLVKCKKNHPNSDLIACPYDAFEYIKPSEFRAHLPICRKKKGLDVSEEYMRLQFESSQHGDCRPTSYEPLPRGLVTGEWDESEKSGSDDDHHMTLDELNEMEQKNERSQALQKACKYTPVIPVSLFRGKPTGLSTSHLDNSNCNKSSSFNTNFKSSFIPNHCEDYEDDNGGIFDDVEEDEAIGEEMRKGSKHISSINTNNTEPHFIPSMGRGINRQVLMMGRGISEAKYSNVEDMQKINNLMHLKIQDAGSSNIKSDGQSPTSSQISESVDNIYSDFNEDYALEMSNTNKNYVPRSPDSSCAVSLESIEKTISFKHVKSEYNNRNPLDDILYDLVSSLPLSSKCKTSSEPPSKSAALEVIDSSSDNTSVPVCTMGRGRMIKEM